MCIRDSTDSVEGIRAATYEGLSFGSGDSVIGINPSDDSVSSVSRLLEMTKEAVSYTHLDVYKRQPARSFTRAPPTPRRSRPRTRWTSTDSSRWSAATTPPLASPLILSLIHI